MRAFYAQGAGGEELDKPTFPDFEDFTCELPHETMKHLRNIIFWSVHRWENQHSLKS